MFKKRKYSIMVKANVSHGALQMFNKSGKNLQLLAEQLNMSMGNLEDDDLDVYLVIQEGSNKKAILFKNVKKIKVIDYVW